MFPKYIMRGFHAAGFISMWFAQSSADGKVTSDEMLALVEGLAEIFKIKIDFELPKVGGK